MWLYLFFFLLTMFFASCKDPRAVGQQPDETGDSLVFSLDTVATGVISPVGIENAGDGTDRLFIVGQYGVIHIIRDGNILEEPFLDVREQMVKLNNTYAEQGLLGLAFHPDYRNNGRFFVYYSAPSDVNKQKNKSVVAEYTVSKDNPDKANPEGKVLLTFEQPENNHNGGSLAFGPDGMLYIGSGDGGGKGDQHGRYGNAQDLSNLLGKILRIDVDQSNSYSIPPDNPFRAAGQRPEIYAYGLRNPWRISFDKATGDLFVADVGQDQYEEVNIVEKGKNYGWRYMEGYHIYDEGMKDVVKNPSMPIHEYDHSQGISITGGYVYNGTTLKDLYGTYIFADWEGNTWFLQKDKAGKWHENELVIKNKPRFYINSFGVDEQGEIYLATQPNIGAVSKTGTIYKLVK